MRYFCRLYAGRHLISDQPQHSTNDGQKPNQHRRQPGGNYAGAIESLVSAGADIKAPGNKFGAAILGMAEGNPEIQEILRRLGAT